MSKKSSDPSSVQVSKQTQLKLRKIAFFTNRSQAQIIEDFVDALHDCMRKDFLQSTETGEFIAYLVNVKSTCGISPIVSGTF